MLTAIIDYESGNLHSAQKAFERVAHELGEGEVVVTTRAEDVARADHIVLPGDGAFPACAAALRNSGCFEAMVEAVEQRGRPFLGICVGMQLMARIGHEYEETEGLGWVDGEILRITPSDPALKVPHMGWNDLVIDRRTPISCIPTRCGWPISPPSGSRMWNTARTSPPSSAAAHAWACSSTRKRAGRRG